MHFSCTQNNLIFIDFYDKKVKTFAKFSFFNKNFKLTFISLNSSIVVNSIENEMN
jgi:hypothetical protein